MKEVFIVIAKTDQSDFVDSYGSCAPESIEIYGVYAEEEKAIATVDRLNKEDEFLVAETDCDPTVYSYYKYAVRE